MAFETCSGCGTMIVFGAKFRESLPYCPSCISKARERLKQQRAVLKAQEEMESLERSGAAYKAALAKLKESPGDPSVREEALRLGRLYAFSTRQADGGAAVTIFDEVALANDIQAACAAANAGFNAVAVRETVEARLQRLSILRSKDLISEVEFTEKRRIILADL